LTHSQIEGWVSAGFVFHLQDGGDSRLFSFCGGKQFEALLSPAGNLMLVELARLNSVLHNKVLEIEMHSSHFIYFMSSLKLD